MLSLSAGCQEITISLCLDYVKPTRLFWVDNTNELNTGYAVDGYARMKGLSTLVITYRVGELSAINAVAGAYTEHAAVIYIVGSLPRPSQESRLMIHHMLGDGEYRRFGQMYSHFTVAQINLVDPKTPPEQIDNMLKQYILQSRPVYIEVPLDMVAALTLTVRGKGYTLTYAGFYHKSYEGAHNKEPQNCT